MDNKEVRKRNLDHLAEQFGGVAALANRLDRTAVQVSQWRGGKGIGDRLARAIEESLGHERGWLDRPQWQTEAFSYEDSRSQSHSGGLDRATLHEALTLLFYDELNAGDYTPQARTDRLAELYGWVLADGGRLSKARNAAFVQQVSERHESTRGSNATAKAGNRPTGRTGASRP